MTLLLLCVDAANNIGGVFCNEFMIDNFKKLSRGGEECFLRTVHLQVP